MNKSKLKSYAPAARRDFIQAVTDRAHFFGLSEKQILPVEESGDVAIIGGRPFPRAVAAQRRKLDARVKRDGFSQVMEAVAYTWFNRFLALRYMELHGYLEHGFRVLSNTGSSTVPEILDHAAQLDLPGLNKQKVVEMKLDGSKDAELYRLLLVAQCNALHDAMPFLFEKIEDETELLLPDNLLHSDSLIRKLVTEIDEEDWQEVEIIGWLYQFYISEKKDQVIGSVVKSEDIPAATQLFTPNWIVKYMVQNSLGRQWLATYPDSPLKTKMEYYIEPAEQTDDVKAQLALITPDSLDPEKLTLLDPASGSGHILVEAYDVFKEIYLERGYSNRDFPRLILEKNLFGLDIDDRAAQMAGFALLMKARKDDRRILRSDNPVKLNIMAIQESGDISIENAHWGEHANTLRELVDLFRQGKTFGSLIQVPAKLANKLPIIKDVVKHAVASGDLYVSQTARELMVLVRQAMVLAREFNYVVANPPYMGAKYYPAMLKKFINTYYEIGKGDLYTCFILRNIKFTLNNGLIGMITIPNWMFLTTFEGLREWLIQNSSITTFCHNGRGVFGSDFGSCAFTIQNSHMPEYKGSYKRLFEKQGSVASNEELCKRFISITPHFASSKTFANIPGKPIAYWVSESIIKLFSSCPQLGSLGKSLTGLQTGDTLRFLKYWHEVSFSNIGFNTSDRKQTINGEYKWFPCNKGGAFRRWYGNYEYVVDWQFDGKNIKGKKDKDLKEGKITANNSKCWNQDFYFKKGLSWCLVTAGSMSVRYINEGTVFDINGPTLFLNDDKNINYILSFMNSSVTSYFATMFTPTISFTPGIMSQFPILDMNNEIVSNNAAVNVLIAKSDWDSFEYSWDFKKSPLLDDKNKNHNIFLSWQNLQVHCAKQISKLQELETENNKLFIEAYGLQDELPFEVPEDQINLTRADREEDIKRLLSYSIGCMMGRYSLDHPGLVYANSGNEGFDSSKYVSFPADDDGIVPIMDIDWFPDDAASRFNEFLKVAWSPETLEENLKFVADSLSPKGGETPQESIRRYISTQFYKDHLQTYKRRPIYWLFSSGKQRAFECLVYLHRYNQSTLSRMRNEYVTPLQGKFSAQVDYLVNEVNTATSTAERNRLQKQLDTLRKKQVELAVFDDLLRHYADQRISLDLDDGVKVNYGKFGNLLAEVKAITGGKED